MRASTHPRSEDVITGCVQQYGEQSYNIGRNAWLQAGLPIETPATTIDRQCGSAQQAVNFAASLVASGVHDVVIGGGVEHMGHIPLSVNSRLHQELGSPFPQELLDRFPLVHQGLSAELIAREVGRHQGGQRRDRAPLAAACGARNGGGPVRAGDPSLPGQRSRPHDRPGHPP